MGNLCSHSAPVAPFPSSMGSTPSAAVEAAPLPPSTTSAAVDVMVTPIDPTSGMIETLERRAVDLLGISVLHSGLSSSKPRLENIFVHMLLCIALRIYAKKTVLERFPNVYHAIDILYDGVPQDQRHNYPAEKLLPRVIHAVELAEATYALYASIVSTEPSLLSILKSVDEIMPNLQDIESVRNIIKKTLLSKINYFNENIAKLRQIRMSLRESYGIHFSVLHAEVFLQQVKLKRNFNRRLSIIEGRYDPLFVKRLLNSYSDLDESPLDLLAFEHGLGLFSHVRAILVNEECWNIVVLQKITQTNLAKIGIIGYWEDQILNLIADL